MSAEAFILEYGGPIKILLFFGVLLGLAAWEYARVSRELRDDAGEDASPTDGADKRP